MEYFTKNKTVVGTDGLFHNYYIYDDTNDRLYYFLDNLNKREIVEPEKSKILSNKTDFKDIDCLACYRLDFYKSLDRYNMYSRPEQYTRCISFVDKKSYETFIEYMKDLKGVEVFITDGVKKLGSEAAHYVAKNSGYESLLFEALRAKAEDFFNSYVSPLFKEEDIKLSFAIDVENFIKDRFFLDVNSKWNTWLCYTLPKAIDDEFEKNNVNNGVTYFGFGTYSRDCGDGLYHVYYVYDKLEDELYVKLYSNCHIVTGVQRANIFKNKNKWTLFKREDCDNPDYYKGVMSYLFLGKDENNFLEFSDKDEKDKFASIATSWKSFKDFLTKVIAIEENKDWAKKIYEKSGSVSLLFSLLRRAHKYFPSYLSVDTELPEKEDFLSRSLRVLVDKLSYGDDSLFIADIERAFNDIFKEEKIDKGSKVLLASKKIINKENKFWKVYTNKDDELKHDSDMLKSMGYEVIETQY